MLVFSKIHKDAINPNNPKKIKLYISPNIRRRIFYLLQNYDSNYYDDGYHSDLYERLPRKLLEQYGTLTLTIYKDGNKQETEGIEEFFLYGWVPHVFDGIELFCHHFLDDKKRVAFFKEMNEIFLSEDLPYRMIDNQIVILDSAFLESEVLNKTLKLLDTHQILAAHQNFSDAVRKFSAKDYDGVIYKCNESIESLLKYLSGKETASQGELKKWLMKEKIIPDYFQSFCDSFSELLQSTFNIANQLRHGKKEIPDEKNKVDRPVANFMLHLTGTLLLFILQRYEVLHTSQREEINKKVSEDDIPF